LIFELFLIFALLVQFMLLRRNKDIRLSSSPQHWMTSTYYPSSLQDGNTSTYYPSSLQSDRMEINEAMYGSRSVRGLLKMRYDNIGFRRLRITKLYALEYLFGLPEGSFLTIKYTYRDKQETINITVVQKNEYHYLEKDLVIPDNLVEDHLPEYKLGVDTFRKYLEGKRGLELGGPSSPFRGNVVPLYNLIGTLDNVNFAAQTLWEKNLVNEGPFKFAENKPVGVQYIMDATNIWKLKDKNYEVVASCHTLEHISNPLKAVKQMTYLLSSGGVLLMILPYKFDCFDHFRDFTTMDHLIKHYIEDTPESSLEHIDEVFMLSDLQLDTPAGNIFQFLGRSSQNEHNRAIHQHLFHFELLSQICDWAGLSVVHQDRDGLNLLTICQKP